MNLEKLENGSYRADGDPGEPGYLTPRVSITDEEGEILAGLVAGLAVLEIGTGLGVSTRWLAETAAAVLTVDVDPWVHAHVWPLLGVGVETARPDQLAERLAGAKVQAAFIDGHHTTDAVVADIGLVLPHMAKGGIWIFHDTHSKQVLRAIEGVGMKLRRTWPTAHGLGVAVT